MAKKQSGWGPKFDRKRARLKKQKGGKKKPASAKTSKPAVSAKLDAELAKICEVAPPPPDDRLAEYLKQVYRLRIKVVSSIELQEAIKSQRAQHPRTSRNYIGTIVRLTAPEHVTPKMKYKYVSTLMYALKKDVEPNGLIEFMRKNGGLNGCCKLWGAEYGRRRS